MKKIYTSLEHLVRKIISEASPAFAIKAPTMRPKNIVAPKGAPTASNGNAPEVKADPKVKGPAPANSNGAPEVKGEIKGISGSDSKDVGKEVVKGVVKGALRAAGPLGVAAGITLTPTDTAPASKDQIEPSDNGLLKPKPKPIPLKTDYLKKMDDKPDADAPKTTPAGTPNLEPAKVPDAPKKPLETPKENPAPAPAPVRKPSPAPSPAPEKPVTAPKPTPDSSPKVAPKTTPSSAPDSSPDNSPDDRSSTKPDSAPKPERKQKDEKEPDPKRKKPDVQFPNIAPPESTSGSGSLSPASVKTTVHNAKDRIRYEDHRQKAKSLTESVKKAVKEKEKKDEVKKGKNPFIDISPELKTQEPGDTAGNN